MEPDGPELGIEGLSDLREIGRGGFAVVYRARQPAFEREVAVKILDVRLDDHSLTRFNREIKAMAALGEHPGIVSLYDAGTTSAGRPYLLMPYLSGGSLKDLLDRGQRFGWREVREIGVRLASALQAAHDEGILHRDLKPANVLRGRYGDPMLADFGIARIAGGHVTTSGVVTASIAFAAPEILEGGAPSVASDVYGLAATLYSLIAGRGPFESADTVEESVLPMITRTLTAELADLEQVPPAFMAVLRKAMARDPSARHATASALGAALAAIDDVTADDVADRSVTPDDGARADRASTDAGATVRGLPGPAGVPGAGRSTPTTSALPRWAVPAGLLAGLGVVVVLAVIALTGRGDEQDDGAAQAPVGAVDVQSPGTEADAAPDQGVAGSFPHPDVAAEEIPLLARVAGEQALTPGEAAQVDLGAGEVVRFVVDVAAGQGLRAVARSDGDTVMALLDAGDQYLVAVDDGAPGNSLDAIIDYLAPQDGPLSLLVGTIDGDPAQVEMLVQVTDPIPLESVVEGEISTDGGVATYFVPIDAAGLPAVVMDAGGQDAALRLVDLGGVVANETSGNGPARLDLTFLEPGDYLLSAALDPGQTGRYRLEVTEGDPVLAVLACSGPDAADLPRPEEVTRVVEPDPDDPQALPPPIDLEAGEVAAFEGELSSEEALHLIARGEGLDTVLALYTADDELVAADDDSGGGEAGVDAMLQLPPGPSGPHRLLIAFLDRSTSGTIQIEGQAVPVIGDVTQASGQAHAIDTPGGAGVFALAIDGEAAPASIQAQSDVDWHLRVVDPAGCPVGAEVREGGNPPLDLSGLEPGPYALFVFAPGPQTGAYTLQLG